MATTTILNTYFCGMSELSHFTCEIPMSEVHLILEEIQNECELGIAFDLELLFEAGVGNLFRRS